MNDFESAAVTRTLQLLTQTLAWLDEQSPLPEPFFQMRQQVDECIHHLQPLLQQKAWPEPTSYLPSEGMLWQWFFEDSGCQATDGCWVEDDGVCPHGYPSWLLWLDC